LKDVNGDIFSLYGQASGMTRSQKMPILLPRCRLLNNVGVEKELSPILKTWEAIKTTDIAAMNQH